MEEHDHPMRQYDPRRLDQMPGDEAFLHLLRCPPCRDSLLAYLEVEKVTSAPPAPAPPRKKPAVRKETQWLFDALLRLSSKKRDEALLDRRYQRLDLLELILDRSEQAQAKDFERADELAWLGVLLATHLDADAEDDAPLRKYLLRGFCLAGNARRMLGDLSAADSAFGNASFFLADEAAERGLYCRTLALLRWDQGRLDEAAALLRYAASAYVEEKDGSEEGVCCALLGLLYAEAEEHFRALGPLLRAQLALALKPRLPWLELRVAFAMALCLAEEGRQKEARMHFGTANALLERAASAQEPARTDWLRGRIEARLGEPGTGERLLEAARHRFLEERRLAEATLVTLDLAVVLEEGSRRDKTGAAITELDARSAGLNGRDVALEVLREFASDKLAGTDPRQRARLCARQLRQTFRLRNLWPGELPWI